MRKRERRVKKAQHNLGTAKAGHGWAARQAGKRHNRRTKHTYSGYSQR